MTDHATSQPSDADRVLTPLANASERQGLSSVAENLSTIRDWLADDLATLEEDIAGSITEVRARSHSAALHLLGQRGKRVRPLVTLLASRMGGEQPPEARHLAVACELVHAATLLHDDVLDLGNERRGAQTARVVYGNSASVLGGDHLLLEALRRVRRSDNIELLDGVIGVIDQMVEAEALQLDRRDKFEPSREKYMDVAEGKTAVLFSWGMHAGATVGGLSAEQAETLSSVGRNLGLAFQAVDDCLDLAGSDENIGKDLFVDIREGKLTLPLIYACQHEPALISRLEAAAHSDPEQAPSDDELRALMDDVRATGALDEARDEARAFSDQAIKDVLSLPESPARDALAAVIQASVDRMT